MHCEQCPDPVFIEYANGSRRCARHAVSLALLDYFDPADDDDQAA